MLLKLAVAYSLICIVSGAGESIIPLTAIRRTQVPPHINSSENGLASVKREGRGARRRRPSHLRLSAERCLDGRRLVPTGRV